MKSVICSVVLIVSLTAGSSLFAQSKAHAGGPPAGRGPGAGAPSTGRPADVGTRNVPTQTKANAPTAQHPSHEGKLVSDHPALASNLQKLLPAGTNLDAAAAGFKNMGQFVAAVHVSNNLNIPFDQLKTKMTTGHMSLGEAVHTLKPELSKDAATTEVKKAETEAKTETTTTTTKS
jgi:hypothetical protein